MSGMLAFAAGGLAKGLGDGAMLVGKDRMEAAQKALEAQQADDRQSKLLAAEGGFHAQDNAAHTADVVLENTSREKVSADDNKNKIAVAGLEQSGAAARGMLAYSNITTDEATGNKYLVSPDGKTITQLKDPTTGKPLTGTTNVVKDNPEKAVADAFKAAVGNSLPGEPIDYDAIKTQLDVSGVKYDKDALAQAKVAAEAAKAAKDAADPKNQPGIISKAFDALFGGSKATDTGTKTSPKMDPETGEPVTGSTYKQAQDVKDAYAQGKIDPDTGQPMTKAKANQLLQSQFNYKP